MSNDLARKTACDLASLIASKAVSPVEVLDAHLAVIARVNPKLNAIVTLVADDARVLAKQAEAAIARGETLGALHGLPVVIKDITTADPHHLRLHCSRTTCHRRRRRSGACGCRRHRAWQDQYAGIAAGANTFNEVFGATRNLESALSPRPVRWFGRLRRHRHMRWRARTSAVRSDAGVVQRHVGIRPTPG